MAIPSNINRTELGQTQIFQRAFDEAKDRLRVDADVTIGSATVNVDLSYRTDSIALGDPTTNNLLKINTNGSIDANVVVDHTNDSIRLGDGTSYFTSTNSGSKTGLDVNILNSISTNARVIPNGVTMSRYNEIMNVASGVLSQITTYTVPGSVTNAYLARIEFLGDNIATYWVKLNGTVIDKKITYFGGMLSTSSEFDVSVSVGLLLNPGDIVTTEILHNRPDPGTFSARILAMEL